MNTLFSTRPLALLAAVGLAAASLTACMPTSVADGCKQLEAEMGPLNEKANKIFTDPVSIADGIDEMIGDMKTISGKVGNPEVKQAWDEMTTGLEESKPVFQKIKELSADPSKALQNVEEIQKLGEEVKPQGEKIKAAAEKLQELCPGVKDLPSTSSN